MTTMIQREKVSEAAKRHDATLIEILDKTHFDEFHLPGAINVPIDGGDFDSRIRSAVPSKSQRVILYGQDASSPACTTAATRMEKLGYQNVFQYTGGKMDWKRAGLPIEN